MLRSRSTLRSAASSLIAAISSSSLETAALFCNSAHGRAGETLFASLPPHRCTNWQGSPGRPASLRRRAGRGNVRVEPWASRWASGPALRLVDRTHLGKVVGKRCEVRRESWSRGQKTVSEEQGPATPAAQLPWPSAAAHGSDRRRLTGSESDRGSLTGSADRRDCRSSKDRCCRPRYGPRARRRGTRTQKLLEQCDRLVNPLRILWAEQ